MTEPFLISGILSLTMEITTLRGPKIPGEDRMALRFTGTALNNLSLHGSQ
jgi:hypothetical protein